jgi:hypothetical protein
VVDVVERAIYELSVRDQDIPRAVQSLDRLATVEEKVTRATRTTADGLERMISRLDARTRAERQLAASLEQLQRLQQENIGTDARRAQAVGLVVQRYHEQIAAINKLNGAANDNNRALGQATTNTRAFNQSMAQLSFQVNDVVTGLASGQRPMQVFTQQAGQFVQVFQQGGGVRAVLGGAADAIRGMITPMTLAVAGLATLGAGLGLVIARALQLETDLRGFRTTLSGMGTDSLSSADGLEAVVDRLREMKLGAQEARDAIQQVIRTPGINPAPNSVQRIVGAGADLGAARGTGTTAGTTELLKAIQDGPEGLIKLGIELRKIEPDQIRMIRDLKDTQGSIVATDRAFGILSGNLGGTYARSLGQIATAWKDLTANFDAFLKDAAISSEIQRFIKDIGDMLASIREVIAFIEKIRNYSPGNIIGSINEAGDAATKKAIENKKEMDDALATRGPGPTGAVGRALPPPGGVPFPTLANPNVPLVGIPGPNGQLPPGWRMDQAPAGAFDPSNPFATSLSSSGGFWRSPSQIARSSQSTLAGNNNIASILAPTDQSSIIEKETRAYEKRNAALSQFGLEQVRALAAIQGLTEAEARGLKGTEAKAFADQFAAQAVRERVIELGKEVTIQDERTRGEMRVLDAFKESEAAGYRAIAQEQARIEVLQKGGDVTVRTRQILEESAVSAIQSGQKQVAAALPQVAAAERIAEAAKLGGAAQRDAEIQASAAARTQDALAKAEASRNPGLIAQAKALNDAALAEARRSDAAKASLANTQAIRGEGEQQQILRLQVQMQGQTSEQINKQVDLLRTKIDLDKLGSSLTEEEKNNRLASVAATGDMTAALAQANREQQRMDETVRSIASSIENELTGAVERAFSGEKIKNWGERIRSMLSSALSTLTANLFIRPALGSIAGGLGFGNVAQGLGSFGSFGGTSQPTATLTPNGQGGFNISTLSSGASVISSASGGGIFGGSSGGLFGTGGITNFLNNDIGTSLGFWGGVPNAPGLFGTTSFTGFLGGAGAGLGAGMLLNGLMGGNPVTGGIGSGVGSLAGAAIGSMFGGPMIGGLLGGALGSLFGMFGNNKPSNASAGGSFNLATGQLVGGFAGGNSQIDQATQNVVQATNAVIQALTAAGGTLSGNLLIQNGVNTGITADSTLPGFTGRFSLGKDPAAAARTIGLALAQSVEGVSDTVRKIIDSTTDLNALADNLAFAQIYDSIKTAADEAFASVEDATKRAGPFDQAMQQINATFAEITRRATEFGLALEPVNAALAEATRRLQEDFVTAVNASFNEATGRGGINVIQAAWDQYFASTVEANAVGLTPAVDPAVHNQLGQIFTAQVNAALAGMTPQQIDEAVRELDNLSDTVFPDLAAAAREVAASTAPALASLNALADSLTAGPLSGLTGAAAVQAANETFNQTLALVQAGTATFDALAAAGDAFAQASIAAYGNAPQTEANRQLILAGINPFISGFASGTMSTPPGTILVGERGPELITQSGGMRVWNNPDTQRMLAGMPGRHFADGTMMFPANDMPSYGDLLAEIRKLRREMVIGNRIALVAGAATEQWLPRIGLSSEDKPVVLAPAERVRVA